MKKKISIIVCILVTCLLGGCDFVIQERGDEEKNQIYKMEVWSAAENEAMIYHVQYPYFYYGFANGDMGNTTLYDFEHATDREDVSKEDFEYLRDYVSGLPDEKKEEDSVFAYAVVFSYYDENGDIQNLYAEGYDEFPEGFDGFIDKVNDLCGMECLTGSGSLQQVTPEYLTKIWGVTDEDVPGGTLADVIRQGEIDMKKLTDVFHMENALKGFYASQKESRLEPYYAYELQSVESTQEEYDAFVSEFAKRLAANGYELEKSKEEVQFQDYMTWYNNSFYIARSCDLSKMDVVEPYYEGGYYQIDLDAHMEGMIYSADFIYSRDGKFVLIDCNDVDIQEAFVQ